MLFTPSMFQNEFHAGDDPWDPSTWGSEHEFASAIPLPVAQIAHDQPSMIIARLDESHQHFASGFDEKLAEQPDLSGHSTISTATLSLTPLSDAHSASALEASSVSPTTISSSSTVPVDPAASFKFVQYSPSKKQKKSQAPAGRVERSRAKEAKPRATSYRAAALQTDKAPRVSYKRDSRGNIAGTENTFGLNQIARIAPSNAALLATLMTRQIGACSRCAKNKQRCDRPESIYQPCSRCIALAASFKYSPCMRVDILDLSLHRKGPTLLHDFDVWVDGKMRDLALSQDANNSHVLFLTQGFGEPMDTTFSVTVSRFEPAPGDRTTYHWTDPSGQLRTMETPPYFISDPDAARQNIQEFLQNNQGTYIDHLLADSNPLVQKTFQAALHYRAFNKSQLVSDALDSWVASRLIENQWRVFCGGVGVGLGPVDEPGHPWQDFTPVTPIMDTQLDDLAIRVLIGPLTQRFLKRLKAKIDERKKENWLEIYFAIFIMMSNIGWEVKDMIANANWKGLKPGNRGGTLTQGFIHACKTMLSYFHFACNGSAPISHCISESSDNREAVKGMVLGQTEYLRSVEKEISRQDSQLTNWRNMTLYENDGIYWVLQLFAKDWRGDMPYLGGEIDDYGEYDFISSSTT